MRQDEAIRANASDGAHDAFIESSRRNGNQFGAINASFAQPGHISSVALHDRVTLVPRLRCDRSIALEDDHWNPQIS
jgi:hypothetical protein